MSGGSSIHDDETVMGGHPNGVSVTRKTENNGLATRRNPWFTSKRKCMMQRERKQYKEAIVALAVWLASCAFCASTMMYFYGLSHSETVLYPFNSRSEQTTAVWQTAGEAMLCSSWTILLSLNRKRNPISTALRAAIGTGLSLSVFAVVGLQSCLSGWHPFFT
jgi:hypothetical protein